MVGPLRVLSQAQALLGELLRRLQFGADNVKGAQAPEHRIQLDRVAEEVAELAGTPVGSLHLRCGVAREACLAPPDAAGAW